VCALMLENVVNTSKPPPAFQEINLILMATYEKKPPRLMRPRPAKKPTAPLPTKSIHTITFNFSHLEQIKSLHTQIHKQGKTVAFTETIV